MPSIRPILPAALALALAACAGGPEPRPMNQPLLEGVDWRLVSVPGPDAAAPPPAEGAGAAVLRFEPGRFSIRGPCNQHTGEWRWDGERLRLGGDVGAIASTKRLCPGEMMARERNLLAALVQPLEVVQEGTVLRLVAQDGSVVRFDSRAAPPAAGRELVVLVAGQRAPCTGVAPGLCLQVRTSPGAPWQLHHGEIEGFTFEPGVESVLRVKELSVDHPPADGSSVRWVLVEVLEQGR